MAHRKDGGNGGTVAVLKRSGGRAKERFWRAAGGDVDEVIRQTRGKKLRDRLGQGRDFLKKALDQTRGSCCYNTSASPLPPQRKKRIDIDMSSKWSGD